jgi:hypothetical protein
MQQMQNSQQLNEGLRPLDLENLVNNLIEVDTYRSKMGEDRDVCVLTFKVDDRAPAKDLMEFIEKGYDFVLDSDISSGENNQGDYFVFVELERSPKLAGQIKDITYGVKRLSGTGDWNFKYYKENRKHELTTESLEQVVPMTAGDYDSKMNRFRTEDVKRFFNRTLMDDLSVDGDVITIHKPYSQQIKLKMVREGSTETVLEETSGSLELDNVAMGEIFWLTKVLGDYNINKTASGFVFENGDKAMILKRMEQ